MSRPMPRWQRTLPTTCAGRKPAVGRRDRHRLSELLLAATAAAILIAFAARCLLAAIP